MNKTPVFNWTSRCSIFLQKLVDVIRQIIWYSNLDGDRLRHTVKHYVTQAGPYRDNFALRATHEIAPPPSIQVVWGQGILYTYIVFPAGAHIARSGIFFSLIKFNFINPMEFYTYCIGFNVLLFWKYGVCASGRGPTGPVLGTALYTSIAVQCFYFNIGDFIKCIH